MNRKPQPADCRFALSVPSFCSGSSALISLGSSSLTFPKSDNALSHSFENRFTMSNARSLQSTIYLGMSMLGFKNLKRQLKALKEVLIYLGITAHAEERHALTQNADTMSTKPDALTANL